jgi:hypothetical protein
VPAPYNAIEDKAELAVQAVIRAAATGVPDAQVFTTFQSGYDTPTGTHSVSVTCEGGLEDGFGTGAHRLSIRVQVSSNLDQSVTDEGGDEVSTHRTYAGKVFDAISIDSATLAASLTSSVADLTVFDSIAIRHGRLSVRDRKAVSEMMLEFTAIPSAAEE